MKKTYFKKMISYFVCVILAIVFSACGAPNEEKGEASSVSCVISVSCEEILRHMEDLAEEKKALVPENGMILEETKIETEKTSALALLEKEL